MSLIVCSCSETASDSIYTAVDLDEDNDKIYDEICAKPSKQVEKCVKQSCMY